MSVVCILPLFQLALGTLGDKQFNFLQDSIGRRVRPKTTDVGSVREGNRKSTCTTTRDYYRKRSVLDCDAKYIEALLKQSKDDGCLPLGAVGLDKCGTNHNGTICAAFQFGDRTYNADVLASCFNLSDGIYRLPSAGECKSECIQALRRLSDKVGCCIHTSSSTEIFQVPSLWMNCGVEQPEPCTDTPIFEAAGAPDLSATLRPCSYEYLLTQEQYTYCKYLGEELNKINIECGFSEQATLHKCGYHKGQYCDVFYYPQKTFLSVYDKCQAFFEEGITEWTCNDECEAAIQDLKDTYGCCVITFSSTYGEYTITASQVLRSDLWTSCGIEIPSNCVASSLDQLRPPDDSLKCGVSGSTTVMTERQVQPKTADVGGTSKIIRRDSENTCTKYSNEYFRKIEVLKCDPKYIEALMREENQDSACSPLNRDLGLTNCGTNHNGSVCVALDLTTFAIDEVLASCFNLSDGIYRLPSAGECKSECILALRRLSDQVGCCIYDNIYREIVQTPSLWMNCGVERPEPCADTPMFEDLQSSIALIGQCSYEYLTTQPRYTYCKYLGEELSKINTECGFSEQEYLKRCGYDKGQYCDFLDYPRQTLLSIYDKCHSFFKEGTTDEWTCNDECEAAIQDLKDTYGCCVITFNITSNSVARQVLWSDLWSSCGIEIPSNCIASSVDQLRPPDDSLKCEARGSTTVPVMTYSTLLIMIGLIISTS